MDLDAVMCLKLVADASQDRDGVFDARFVDDHWLKAALEGLVFLDVLSVLVEGGGADHAHLAARPQVKYVFYDQMSLPQGKDKTAGEKAEFDGVLTEVPADKKIAVLKIVRTITGLGLKEAKGMVESAPVTIKEGAPKDEADDIKKQIEEGGGKVELK